MCARDNAECPPEVAKTTKSGSDLIPSNQAQNH